MDRANLTFPQESSRFPHFPTKLPPYCHLSLLSTRHLANRGHPRLLPSPPPISIPSATPVHSILNHHRLSLCTSSTAAPSGHQHLTPGSLPQPSHVSHHLSPCPSPVLSPHTGRVTAFLQTPDLRASQGFSIKSRYLPTALKALHDLRAADFH